MLSVYKCQLKELEKLGPRRGVVSQSVKYVVQSLVDDDRVSKGKIGTSIRNAYERGTNQQHIVLEIRYSKVLLLI